MTSTSSTDSHPQSAPSSNSLSNPASLLNANGLLRHPNQKTLSIQGVTLDFRATSADTQGQWSLIEYTAPPQFRGPAPHWHRHMTEAFYVLEGTLSVQLGEQGQEANAGSLVLVPPRVVHAFSNRTDAPVRFLVLASPAGLEGYFEELSDLIKQEPTWPPADMSRVMALAAKYDTYAPPVEPESLREPEG